MTEDRLEALRDDIAFIKALAQEGRRAPLLGGAILMLAGGVFGLASIGHWAVAAGVLAVDASAYAILWITAMAVFFVGLMVLSARINRMPGASAAVNRASSAAWAAVGGAVFTLAVALSVISYKLQSAVIGVAFPSLILALYGTGWLVSGEMAEKRWIKWLAFASFGFAVAVAFAAGDPVQYLIYAVALVFLAFVPGLILMRGEPSDVV